MLKVGLVGLGCMGTCHFNQYVSLMQNGVNVKLTAICDIDEGKFSGVGTQGNIDAGSMGLDLSPYKLYTDMDEMLEKEDLDYVDICLPTYLHAEKAICAMKSGVHVFCEKPMALSYKLCLDMIETSKETGKTLMIGQTLRYWNVYEYAKEVIDNNTFGRVHSAYFFRGGSTPIWSYENWLLKKDKSGGCLLDQHIHDVDAINWLFGIPTAVSSAGLVVNEGSGYDVVSTNYLYSDGKVINAQDDWTINGNGFGFEMLYRINFEKGALVYEKGKLTAHPVEGEAFEPDLSPENAYYKELRFFIEALSGARTLDFHALIESHAMTIRIAEAEMESAGKGSAVVNLSIPSNAIKCN